MKKILETLKQKWAEYLLEILVITIGVLGAFMLNNWNEDRNNKKLETTFLANINKEFKANKSQFENIQIQRESILDVCAKLESLRPLTINNWDTLKDDFLKIIRIITFDPSQSSIESLINSSSFEIITNVELRNLLIKWPTMVEDFEEEEIWMTENVSECFNWLNHNTDRSDLTLLNEDELIVIQNLLQANCFLNNLLVSPNSQGRNERDELAEAMNEIIKQTDKKK